MSELKQTNNPTQAGSGNSAFRKYAMFKSNIVMIGFGSIGQGTLPLLFRHLDGIEAKKITIIVADDKGKDEVKEFGITDYRIEPLTADNYVKILDPIVGKDTFVVNLSVDVSSAALIKFCQSKDAFYLDTCSEPWKDDEEGGYTNEKLNAGQRSNYMKRFEMMQLKKQSAGKSTAVITHGANPGLVSHFVKQALLNIAKDNGIDVKTPKTREEWAKLAQLLEIKTIHIAEKDTQTSSKPKQPDEFVNTWSVDGFISEGVHQPSELGWGTHEKHFPADGQRHTVEEHPASIYLERPGASVSVRTWTPLAGPFLGFLVTHAEAISIAEYFTLFEDVESKDSSEKKKKVVYRPTAHYSYHPCADAVMSMREAQGRAWETHPKQRILCHEITTGVDELGVLLCGNKKGAYWYGSQLWIEQCRKLIGYQNATSLQVTVSVLAGMIWAIENPREGVVEPDYMDFARVLEIAGPYLGDVVGAYTDWTPIKGRSKLFKDMYIDSSDPWQFLNVRVH